MTERTGGILLTTIASILWGTAFAAVGVGLKYTNPYNLVFLRFLTASIFALSRAYTWQIAPRSEWAALWFNMGFRRSVRVWIPSPVPRPEYDKCL